MKRNSLIFFTAICGLLLSSACKPTEKNYKAAYDKAQEKARQGLATEEYEQMLLNSLPSYERTATDSVRTFVEGVVWQYTPLAVDSGARISPARYNLAVGKYTMLTNAKAHADRLAAEGWRATVFRNGEPEYFVVVKISESLDTVAKAAHDFTARYPGGTVKLHEPMAITPLGGVSHSIF